MAKQKKQGSLDVKKLLKLGKERGFVTQEEILQIFPKPEEMLKICLSYLEDGGFILASPFYIKSPIPESLISEFKKVFALNTFGSREALEQYLLVATNVFGDQNVPVATKQKIGELALAQMAKETKTPFLIEVDGGLTRENLPLCRKAGGQIFAGWSIVKASTPNGVCQKVRHIHEILS